MTRPHHRCAGPRSRLPGTGTWLRPGRHRPLPGDRAARPGGFRAGLPGPGRRPRPPGGDQGAQPGASRRPRGRRGLPGRGPDPRPARPPQHRSGLRRGPDRRRPVLRRLQVHRGERPGRAAEAGPAVVPRVGRAGGDGRRGPAPRPHPRPGPPRHQAGQHPDRRSTASPCVADFGLALQGRGLRQGSPAGRHAGLHEPRAGPGRRAPGRRPLRHLQPGRGLLRAADRPAAVPGRLAHRGDGSDRHAPSRARPGRSTTRSPGSWSGSARRRWRSGPRSGTAPASDMADDLRHFLETDAAVRSPAAAPTPGTPPPASTQEPTPAPTTPDGPTPTGEPVKIVPKGLRSFDGTTPTSSSSCCPARATATACPRASGSGRPGSKRPTPTTPSGSGLIYGPSGCGKSSLVKAGLLPRLAQARAADLRRGDAPRRPRPGCSRACARRVPDLPGGLRPRRGAGRAAARAGLRAGREGAAGHRPVRAMAVRPAGRRRTPSWSPRLRQCDGEHVQASSWSATTSGWRPPGSCGTWRSAWSKARTRPPVDLFDLRHARKVLTAFGRAYGVLPEQVAELTARAARRSSSRRSPGWPRTAR